MNFDSLPLDIRYTIFLPIRKRNAQRKIAKCIYDKIYCKTYIKHRAIIARIYYELFYKTKNPEHVLTNLIKNNYYRTKLNENPQLFCDNIIDSYNLEYFYDLFPSFHHPYDINVFFSTVVGNIYYIFNHFLFILTIAFIINSVMMI